MDERIQSAVIDRFVVVHQWKSDWLVKNVATKMYETATAPHRALVRLTYDAECQRYWLKGEYESEGRNVLSTVFIFFSENAERDVIDQAVDDFLQEAEAAISNTYAVRLMAHLKPSDG